MVIFISPPYTIFEPEYFIFKGYLHEQSRKDRDDYVTINWQNMNSDAQTQYQFVTCEHCDLQNSPYGLEILNRYLA